MWFTEQWKSVNERFLQLIIRSQLKSYNNMKDCILYAILSPKEVISLLTKWLYSCVKDYKMQKQCDWTEHNAAQSRMINVSPSSLMYCVSVKTNRSYEPEAGNRLMRFAQCAVIGSDNGPNRRERPGDFSQESKGVTCTRRDQ